MTDEQLLPAFLAALHLEGVDPAAIDRAVARVRDLRLGESISGRDALAPLRRDWAFAQADRLVRT